MNYGTKIFTFNTIKMSKNSKFINFDRSVTNKPNMMVTINWITELIICLIFDNLDFRDATYFVIFRLKKIVVFKWWLMNSWCQMYWKNVPFFFFVFLPTLIWLISTFLLTRQFQTNRVRGCITRITIHMDFYSMYFLFIFFQFYSWV